MTTEGTVNPEKENQPNPEEKLKNLETQLKETSDKYKTLEDSHKSLQTKYNKKYQDEQGGVRSELASLKSDMAAQVELIKILAAGQSQGITVDDVDSMSPKAKVDLVKEFENRQAFKKQQEDTLRKQEEFNAKANDIYSRAEKVYGDDVDALHSFRNLIRNGDFDLAEKKLVKAEAKVETQVTDKKQETDEEKTKRMEAEIEKRILTKYNLLDTETGLPAGKAGTKEEAYAKYARGEMTTEEAKKAGITF
jgi:ABC-type nitrate/sulfonate/bicarbonate transport system substrate-binding protein